MKTIKTILFTFLICSVTMNAQIHVNAGIADLDNFPTSEQTNFSIGYTHYIANKIGIGSTYRMTHSTLTRFEAFEFIGKYRIERNKYRLDLGVGYNYNQKDWEFRPMVSVRNSFQIHELSHVSLDVDRAFKKGTYISIGITLDCNIFKDPFGKRTSTPRFY